MATQWATSRRQRGRGHLSVVVPLEFPLESFCERALDAIDDEGWITDTSAEIPSLPDCDEFTTSWRKAKGSGGPQLRARWLQSGDFRETTCKLLVPEVMYNPQTGVLYDGVEEFGIERLIAPGDAEVFERCSVTTGMANLTATMWGDVGDMFRLMWGRRGEHGRAASEKGRYRWTIRRDYPEQGEVTTVFMPRHPETGELLLSWGDMSAVVFNIRPHSESRKMVVTLFEELLMMPSWVPHWATMKIVKAHRSELHQMLQMMPRIFDSINEQVSIDASYAIARLKKSSRGGPLLPLSVGDSPISLEQWEQFDVRKEHVSIYLNEFLHRLGFAETIFYDSLHGRRLVHFQAAVQRGAWERVRVAFDARFCEQRSAFRHIRGGRTAPELDMDVEPRFLSPPPSDACFSAWDSTSVLPISPAGDAGPSAVVRSTFLHFSERPHEPTLRRSQSGSL